MEESGIQNTLPPERVGTYMGSGIGGMATFANEQNLLMEKGPPAGVPPSSSPA